jgi:cellulase/cellobiase CelA1
MTNRLFSTCIIAYKRHFLNECITCVFNQNYKKYKVAILNAFSPDPIDDVVNNFVDKRISCFKNSTNYGAQLFVDNLNKLLDQSTGVYIVSLIIKARKFYLSVKVACYSLVYFLKMPARFNCEGKTL